MRLMGFLFAVLTFLAGVTVANVEIALINTVVFLALALLVARYVPARWAPYGVPFAMTGAFMISVVLPYAMISIFLGADCLGEECTATARIEAP